MNNDDFISFKALKDKLGELMDSDNPDCSELSPEELSEVITTFLPDMLGDMEPPTEEELYDEEEILDGDEYERFLEFKLKKEENEEFFDDYDPELLDEFCRMESIDKKERQIKILIEDYEEYHFNNYQDSEHSIILRYYDEEDYTY